MIWLSLVAFLVAAVVAGAVVRWLRDHAALYGHGMPQRFHLGHVPRLGGVAVLAGTVLAWLLGMAQTAWWGDPGSLRLGAWVGWWLLVLLIPIVGWLVIIIFNCQNGTPGSNRFGADPKQLS